MLSLSFVFWMYIFLFAVVGAMRGWAKELLVACSVVLGIFVISVLEKFVPFVRDTVTGETRFWVRAGIVAILVFFGYQTPKLPRLAESARFIRDTIQDSLLGLFLGAINGYLIFGTIWFYLNDANYPFPYITAPSAGDPFGEAALKLIPMLPPAWLGAPFIYFAVALSFVFVLVVFL
jgi:uncharacterized membrane protein required for colicin V production